MRDLLLRGKNAKLLVSLKDDGKWYPGSLARAAGMSYVHATMVLNELAREGVVEFKQEGKWKKVALSEKGAKIAMALDELMSRMAALEVKEEKKPEEKKEPEKK